MTTRREDIDFPRSRAILVSTSAYSVGFGRVGMPAAANSLAAMRAALVGPCEWPGSRIHELADRSNRDGALQDIAALIHETSDVLIFYYVGHGQLLPGNDLGLALTDTSEDPRLRLSTSLRLSQLRQEMEDNCDARVKIVILDCCCAGIATKYSQGPADLAGQVHQAAMLVGEGTYTWTACGHSQETYFEPGRDGLTYFTRFLTEVASDGIPGRPAGLTLASLHQEVRRRLRRADLPGIPVRPEPTILFRGPVDEFVFARNAAPAGTHGRPDLVPPPVRDPVRHGPDPGSSASAASGGATLLARAEALQASGRPVEAEAAFREAIRLDPTDAAVHNKLANALYAERKFTEAEAAFRETIRLDPDQHGAQVGLYNIYYAQSRFGEAERALREAIRLAPADGGQHLCLGDLLARRGEYDQAERSFREAIRCRPGLAMAHHNLGALLGRKGQFDEGVDALRAAIRIDRTANSYTVLGALLTGIHRYSEAEAALREAIRLDPADSNAHGHLRYLQEVMYE